LGIGVLGYIGIVQHKEHSPEVLSIPPGTPCIYMWLKTDVCLSIHLFFKHIYIYIYMFLFHMYSVCKQCGNHIVRALRFLFYFKLA